MTKVENPLTVMAVEYNQLIDDIDSGFAEGHEEWTLQTCRRTIYKQCEDLIERANHDEGHTVQSISAYTRGIKDTYYRLVGQPYPEYSDERPF
jgi:hypothetical protein